MKTIITDAGKSQSVAGRNECRDCSVRAVAFGCSVSYDRAHQALAKFGRKRRRGVRFHKVAQPVFKELGVEGRCVRRSGSLAKLLRDFSEGILVVRVRGHIFAIANGSVVDDSPEKAGRHINQAWLISA
jgi:hypothetical protein